MVHGHVLWGPEWGGFALELATAQGSPGSALKEPKFTTPKNVVKLEPKPIKLKLEVIDLDTQSPSLEPEDAHMERGMLSPDHPDSCP